MLGRLTCVHIAVAIGVEALEEQLDSLALQAAAGVHQGPARVGSLTTGESGCQTFGQPCTVEGQLPAYRFRRHNLQATLQCKSACTSASAAAAKMRCRLRLAAAMRRSCSFGTSTCAADMHPCRSTTP